MEFWSVEIFQKLSTCLVTEVKCKLKELLSVYVMFPDLSVFLLYLYGEVLLRFQVYAAAARSGVCHTDGWGKDIGSTLRKEGITCGPSWKEFGKAEEVCQIEIRTDEEQRYIHCCVLPNAVSCLPAKAPSFPWCSPWKYPVESGEAPYYYSEIVWSV